MQEGTVAFLQMVGITAAIAAAQGGRAALPGLPARTHDRRRARLLGLARPRHRSPSPARSIGFLGPAGLRGALRRAVPRRACRPPRTSHEHGLIDAVRPARADRRRRRPGAAGAAPPGRPAPRRPVAGPSRATARRRRPRGRRPPGTSSRPRAAPTGPASGGCCAPRRTDVVAAQRHRRRASTTPACCWRWPGSAARPAWCSARTGAGRPMTAPLGPAALREARRGMRLAAELRLPLVTVIDTPGAALSQEAEEGGLAGEIARCLADLVTLEAPTLCGAARAGHRRRRAGPGAGRPGARRAQRLAGPAAAGGRLGDRAPDTDHAGGDGRGTGRAGHRPVAGRHRRPGRARAAGRRRRAGRVLPPAGRGAAARSWCSCCGDRRRAARRRLDRYRRLGD